MEASMPDLSIQIASAKAVPFAALPTLAFQVQISNSASHEKIHTIGLWCQIQIDVSRRSYAPQEQERLRDLFGHPERWGRTLRKLLWTNISFVVPGFEADHTVVDMPVPCSFDFNVAATKYFEGLSAGEIPLLMLFSGTVFYESQDSALQVAPISWNLEAEYKLSLQLWREMMSIYYPNNVWINLRRDTFERLYQYKIEHGIPTWEQALEQVLSAETAVHS
jgi:hypothetical protein